MHYHGSGTGLSHETKQSPVELFQKARDGCLGLPCQLDTLLASANDERHPVQLLYERFALATVPRLQVPLSFLPQTRKSLLPMKLNAGKAIACYCAKLRTEIVVQLQRPQKSCGARASKASMTPRLRGSITLQVQAQLRLAQSRSKSRLDEPCMPRDVKQQSDTLATGWADRRAFQRIHRSHKPQLAEVPGDARPASQTKLSA